MKKIIMLAGVFLALPALARIDCQNITVGDQDYLCSIYESQDVTVELNKAYKEYISKIRQSYSSHVSLGEKLSRKVRLAQERWKSYMIEECNVYAFTASENSSLHSLLVNKCTVKMTKNRIKDINEQKDSL